jgi:8-oxo-dGTP pyrophosphatase MutT (NUDIX family)
MSQAIQATPLLARQLADYQRRWPAETATVQAFLALLEDPQDPFLRERLQGHFTGAAWLVSGDGRHALLLHHRKLDRWLQPGGHADGEHDLARVALREAEEETGLRDLLIEPAIFDLDCHLIPGRPGEPAHWHYDVRYVIRTTAGEDFVASEESHALAWCPVEELARDASIDGSIRRMARKWIGRNSGAGE